MLYREKFQGIRIDSGFGLADLGQLPLVEKSELHAHEYEWASGPGVCAIQNTSGSTGTPLFIYRTAEEYRFLQEFFSRANGSLKEKAPISLHLTIPQHGSPTPIPGPLFTLQAAAHTNKLLSYAVSLLLKRFEVPALDHQVSVLAGDHNSILLLTQYARENPELADQIRLKAACLTGRQLTARWRALIASTFGCLVVDRFTLSEVLGGATSCADCGGYHFDPQVVPEIVEDPRKSSNPVRFGTGYLVLTSLAPFVANQPFIRYRTGDLFRAEATACREISYFPLGRATQSLLSTHLGLSDRPEVLLPMRDLVDAVDVIEDIERPPCFADVSLVRDKTNIGLPLMRGEVEQIDRCIVVRIRIALRTGRTGTLDPWNVPEDSTLSTLARLLVSRIGSFEGVRPEIVLSHREELETVEKSSTFWIDSPQK